MSTNNISHDLIKNNGNRSNKNVQSNFFKTFQKNTTQSSFLPEHKGNSTIKTDRKNNTFHKSGSPDNQKFWKPTKNKFYDKHISNFSTSQSKLCLSTRNTYNINSFTKVPEEFNSNDNFFNANLSSKHIESRPLRQFYSNNKGTPRKLQEIEDSNQKFKSDIHQVAYVDDWLNRIKFKDLKLLKFNKTSVVTNEAFNVLNTSKNMFVGNERFNTREPVINDSMLNQISIDKSQPKHKCNDLNYENKNFFKIFQSKLFINIQNIKLLFNFFITIFEETI